MLSVSMLSGDCCCSLIFELCLLAFVGCSLAQALVRHGREYLSKSVRAVLVLSRNKAQGETGADGQAFFTLLRAAGVRVLL